uniref:La-related protein 1B n=1 Tax=Anthurium amnicola TaxID=1678845 RepID=A0A1D1YP42_9ARAE
MATAADSAPYSSAHSPRFRPNSHNLPSPWSRVVRGEPETTIAPAASPSPPAAAFTAVPPAEPSLRATVQTAGSEDAAEVGSVDAAGAPPPPPSDSSGGEKKSAWNRPSNGLTEAGSVMGADSWPALSEATKAPPKSSSHDSLKGLSNGSVSDHPAPATASPPPKPVPTNTNSNFSANNAAPIREKSMKRGGGGGTGSMITNDGGGALANGGPVQPKIHSTSADMPNKTLDKQANSEPPPRELTSRSSNWDHGSRVGGFSPQSHGGNEHQKAYSGNRRGNNAGGGGGHHHNNFGPRHDQERGGYDWNRRSFGGGRDAQMQQQPQQQPRGMARPFLRPPPPGSAPFIAPPPPPVRPFANPINYPDIPSPLFYVPTPPPPESFRGVPFVAPPAMFLTPSDLQLRAMLVKQIDYYFSAENLCKDVYLRQNMDGEGWVPISLIAGFNRVRNLTNNIQFILDTVRTSNTVEVQGDKIRKRNDWKNWPPLTQTPNPLPSSTMPNYDALAARLTHWIGRGY